MVLVDNINILKEAYPYTWRKFKDLEGSINVNLVQFEDTKKGDKTLYVEKDGKKVYLHSKYDPIRESEAILDEYKEVLNDTTVIFYGIGLGYHVDLFLKRYPNINYYIYEPIPEILNAYLSYKSIKKMSSSKLKDIVLGDDELDIRNFFSQFIDKSNKNILQISLNSHIKIFPDKYKKFIELFKETMKDKKSTVGTNLVFQKRWIINSMKNFGEVLSTPNIIIEKKDEFKNKPAVLVAAGPSLNEEIENLRYIKENGLAYIFSIGSAINTLIHHNIYPDAATTYDPGAFNQNVFKTIKEKDIVEVPMIFGSSVGFETIEDYPGRKYHILTSQDSVSNYYLKDKDEKIFNIVQDASTIAVVTMQLLYKLGFNPIILVGQNLAYRGREQHSEGISYSNNLTDEEIEKSVRVKDVYGNEILTSEGFNSMRQQMEAYIRILPNVKVINTTKGGANIEGTEFIELKKIINMNLKESIVEEDWLNTRKTNYDKDYLENQANKMDKAYIRTLKINKDYNNILNKIEKSINNRKFSQTENLYIKLDKELRKIENNDYYKTFILPMNRVQYKILVDSIDSLNEEKDPYVKGKKIIESFKNFINICDRDIEMIKPIYEEMKENIDKFCSK
ncbi:DUF115 domain-containing protein [Tissierella sp. MSJ-40]|uniref:DUF115 domain-containing protein n=1 Tax=Tissierella simiarum TaxID=2841534 RepID=A0ABS6E196_9FIRM|nr:6-hydroxymethylpterin diphosphokinase MptE-like protein [Tissierella simiarum]MBU5436668.1 DUF115 domain-containing protein [Tissierella simiarum]